MVAALSRPLSPGIGDDWQKDCSRQSRSLSQRAGERQSANSRRNQPLSGVTSGKWRRAYVTSQLRSASRHERMTAYGRCRARSHQTTGHSKPPGDIPKPVWRPPLPDDVARRARAWRSCGRHRAAWRRRRSGAASAVKPLNHQRNRKHGRGLQIKTRRDAVAAGDTAGAAR